MKFAIFYLRVSVDNGPLPGAWVAELLGVILGVQGHKKIIFPKLVYLSKAVKGLRKEFNEIHRSACFSVQR